MPWMQTELPYGASYFPIQDAVQGLHLAKTKAEGRVSFEFALYTRDDGFERSYLLVSPEVAEIVAAIPGSWSVSPGPEAYEWTMLYGDVRSSRLLGVKGRSTPKAPVGG